MNSEDVIRLVIDRLNEHEVPYMLVGSVAANFYCVPRSTQDVDVVIGSHLIAVAQMLSRSQKDFWFDPQLGFESVTATTKALLHATEHEFEVELFELGTDEHDQKRFSRRIRVNTLGRQAWIATVEDLIVTKLRWAEHVGREKDIADARNLIAVQGLVIDWPYVETWCERHGTRSILDRLRRECLPG